MPTPSWNDDQLGPSQNEPPLRTALTRHGGAWRFTSACAETKALTMLQSPATTSVATQKGQKELSVIIVH